MHSIISIFIMFLYMYLTTFENFEFRKFGKVIFIFNKINFLINNIIIYIMHGIDIKSFFFNLFCFIFFRTQPQICRFHQNYKHSREKCEGVIVSVKSKYPVSLHANSVLPQSWNTILKNPNFGVSLNYTFSFSFSIYIFLLYWQEIYLSISKFKQLRKMTCFPLST